MKKAFLACAAVIACWSFVYPAQNFSVKTNNNVPSVIPVAKPFEIGEELVYSLEWLGIPIGKIKLKIEGYQEIRNHNCYYIAVSARPTAFFRRFYNVEYAVATYLDVKVHYSQRFEKTRRVKSDKSLLIIDFDHEKGEARTSITGNAPVVSISKDRSSLKQDIPSTPKIAKGTQDLFSAFYYFRLHDIKTNEVIPVPIYFDERNWVVNFSVGKPVMRELRKKGSLPVVEVRLTSEMNRYILGKRAFFFYFTADDRRIPIEFKLNTGIGSVRGILQNMPSAQSNGSL